MNEYVIAPPSQKSLEVSGSAQRFPVRRVYCVGRNYAAHTVEMGGDPNREEPFFFQKNAENLDQSGRFPYPTRTNDVHHEIELLVALGSGGVNIPLTSALESVWGYGVALDMTRRDIQAAAKSASRPWEMSKAFERSAPCGPLVAAAEIGHPSAGAISVDVNGVRRQSGDLDQMIWKVPEMIAYLSEYIELAAGDVILTGTPAGVGGIERGDVLEAKIEGVGTLEVDVF